MKKYEITKAIGFGALLNKYKKNQTHQKFSNLLERSFEKIKSEVERKNEGKEKISDSKDFIKKIKKYVDLNKEQVNFWEEVSQRPDVIKFTKDYLRSLSRKAKFDYHKGLSLKLNGMVNRRKQPNEIQGKILNYFQETIYKNKKLLENFELLSKQYEESLADENKAHLRPNLVDFQKQFLSILKVGCEWLIPLLNRNLEIVLTDTQKEDDKNKEIVEFDSKENRKQIQSLYNLGKDIKKYIEKNGSQVPFARCTFNYYTARQKPENTEEQIEKLIEELEILKLYDEVKNLSEDQIEEYFEEQKFLNNDKLQFFAGLNLGKRREGKTSMKNYLETKNHLIVIELAQIFKPKPILASVKFELKEKLKTKYNCDKNTLDILFEVIGEKVDIAGDFSDLKKKENVDKFDLEKYPLKLAFDYAWESLARYLQKGRLSESKFAKNQCVEFLRKFGIDDYESHQGLNLYASLSFIRDELVILEHKNENVKKDRIIKAIYNLNNKIDESRFSPKEEKLFREIKHIISRLDINNLDKEKINKELKENKEYQNAKQQLGLCRGGLKNKIEKYGKLTKSFGEVASFLGRKFADLRDKFREEYQFNKISHYAVLLENKEDKYILALEINSSKEMSATGRKEKLDILEKKLKDNKQNKDDIRVRKVSSFTAKTLNKILKNPGGYKKFHFRNEKNDGYYYNRSKHLQIIEKEKRNVIDYIVRCLTISQMSQDQQWNKKFNWEEDLKKCETYEYIEKVLDIKGYYLEEKFISQENIKKLVKEENCLLFPIINQDIQSVSKEDKFKSNKNQFTKDLKEALSFKENSNSFRLHPEFTIFYKFPNIQGNVKVLKNNHKAKILNRNMRFQILGNLLLEKKPDIDKKDVFISRKEKLKFIRDKDKIINGKKIDGEYIKLVKDFNKDVNKRIRNKKRNYFYGIDRGLKELATLCVLDRQNEIQDFIVFKKEKVKTNELSHLAKTRNKKQKEVYRYTGFEKWSILNLTNLKVETWHMADKEHPNSIFLKDAFAKIEKNDELRKIAEKMGSVFDKENQTFKILVEIKSSAENNLKLRMKHYQRLLAFSLSYGEKRKSMFNFAKDNFKDIPEFANLKKENKIEIIKKLFGLDADFKRNNNEENYFEELATNKLQIKSVIGKIGEEKLVHLFDNLLKQFFGWYLEYKRLGEKAYKDSQLTRDFIVKYTELSDLDNLKKGIVSNIVGVIYFLMQKMSGVIVLEDVEKYQVKTIKDALDKYEKITESHSQAEHLKYAGTETYRYLEKMLVRKFEKNGLTPPFADLESLNKIALKINGKEDKNKKQFGIFYYIPARNTSHTCPCCFKEAKRGKKNNQNMVACDVIFCKNKANCGFDTRFNDLDSDDGKGGTLYNPQKVETLAKKFNKISSTSLKKIHSGDECAAYIIANKIQIKMRD